MKNYNEVAHSILSRRDKYDEERRAKKKKIVRISTFVSCFVVALLGVGIWQGSWLDFTILPIANPSTQEGSNIESSSNHISQEITSDKTTVPSTEQSTSIQNTETPTDEGAFSGDGFSLWMIPSLPFDRSISITGEDITDEEAKAYFETNINSIISSLASSETPVDNIRISDKGYSHVYYDGTEGKSFEIRQNYRDYLVYNGDKLIAIITLYKENGEIFNTPSFGAKWFDGYGKYLEEHKGEKLVFVYAKFYEIIIAPDNTYYNPMGLGVTDEYIGWLENPYDVFYHELATYIP